MSDGFSVLEANILKSKGLSEEQILGLNEAGVSSRDDFKTVGDALTLTALVPGLDPTVAAIVMEWAVGVAASMAAAPTASGDNGGRVVLDSPDAVYCIHCGTKQPKDYKSGDLCISCGKQAEPILSCYWCSASGPGKFCRTCGAAFVPTAELDLAILLKREGLPKDEIPAKLTGMSAAEKDDLWGRVRRARG